jgi:hypothetical protein
MHAGRRAFILGNGPSLKISDLDRLRGEITFAANRIFLAYDQTLWRPTYWSCSDLLVAQNNLETIRTLDHVKFVGFNVLECLGGLPYSYTVGRPKSGSPVSNMDLAEGVHPGASVVIFMLKLAFWMGVKVVYLLGLDFHFTVPEGASTQEVVQNNAVVVGQGEINHFHPNYRPAGEKWTMPLLDKQFQEFSLMRWRYEADGRVIYNASRQTRLSAIERVDLDEVLT